MLAAYAEIARVLERARRRRGLVVLLTALGVGLSAAAVALLLGAFALGYGWARPGVARTLSLAGALLSLLVAAGWALVVLRRTALGPDAAARTLGAAEPDIRSDLISSVELHREYPAIAADGRYSVALVDALVERTSERAARVDLGRAIPSRPARHAGLALGATLFVNLCALALAGKALAGGYAQLAGAGPEAPVRRADPITGDIEVTYVYPAHTGRPQKTLSGTGGEITAPKGTEVTLRTRADRKVKQAELLIDFGIGAAPRPPTAAPAPPPPRPGEGEKPKGDGAPKPAAADRPPVRTYALQVSGERDLQGSLTVDEGGAYRFRFTDGKKVVAEGPPIPIVVEPDAFPEVKITAPAAEVEVDAKARVRVDWQGSDDYGLGMLTLVVKPPAGGERRRELRAFQGPRRDAGSFEIDVGEWRLGEGEKLLYWIELTDNDAVSGPKRAASQTQVVKIYSESEHQRAAMAKAQQAWEELVGVLGDRIEALERPGTPGTPDKLAVGEGLDARTRHLHERMREVAAELKKDKAAPKELSRALANVAAGVRTAEERLTAARGSLARFIRAGRREETFLSQRVVQLDDAMVQELEKDVLYLENLFDKQKAEDLVRLAKEMAQRRRDLASLLEKYKDAPTDEAKKELLAEIARMKQRMAEMMRRMAELARGINDEHMNMEALAEMERSQDMMGGLDKVEKMLAEGDIEGAMKELDRLGSAMDQMLSQLQQTAGAPDRKNAELMKEMLAFKKELEGVMAEQQKLAGETEQMKAEYKKRVAERMKAAEELAKRLEQKTAKAREELEKAEKGVGPRSMEDFAQAKDRLSDLERALQMRDFDAALDMARKSVAPMQRLAIELGDDASLSERYHRFGDKPAQDVREAQKHAAAALPPATEVRSELEKLFPDPKSVLGPKEGARMEKLAEQQGQLEQRAGQLREQLEGLMQKAPVFPQQAGQMVGEARGHMQAAEGELQQKNPQRGHGQQKMALDALGRLEKGLEEMAKNQGQGQGGGSGFPFPFGEESGGQERGEGEMGDPSREKVEIPGAEAFKAPEEFRKDLLDAMRQGSPEAYKGEVQRYYEELVK